METLGKLIVTLSFMVGGTLLRGYVFVKLWRWFIVPTFDLNPLRIVEAIGLSMVVGFLVAKKRDFEPEEDKDFMTLLLKGIFWLVGFYGFMLLFGWIISSFM